MIKGLRDRMAWFLDLWSRASSRERLFVSAGVIVALVLLGYEFIVSPYIDRLKVLDRLIVQRESEVAEMGRLRTAYLEARGKMAQVESRITGEGQGFSLFSHVEEIAARQRIKDRILFIRPQPEQTFSNYREVSVEVKFENMTLPQIVGVLEAFQKSSQFIRVKRVDLKTRFNDPKLLDGTFLVASYEKAV